MLKIIRQYDLTLSDKHTIVLRCVLFDKRVQFSIGTHPPSLIMPTKREALQERLRAAVEAKQAAKASIQQQAAASPSASVSGAHTMPSDEKKGAKNKKKKQKQKEKQMEESHPSALHAQLAELTKIME
jgi:hypothetical protein